METYTTPSSIPNPAGVIGQQLFDQYVANWVNIVGNENNAELQLSFQQPGNKALLAAVRFPVKQIARLVSTIGAKHIKARFLVKREEKTGQPHFTLALFATDALDARVSSYYVAEEYWTPALAQAEPLGEENQAEVSLRNPAENQQGNVPRVLANTWLALWGNTREVTPELFASNYGPLRGYTFELQDFLAPLGRLKSLEDEKLQVAFGLHEYYRSTSEDAALVQKTNRMEVSQAANSEVEGEILVHTFGLLVQLESVRDQLGYDPIYDMSAPCPPTC